MFIFKFNYILCCWYLVCDSCELFARIILRMQMWMPWVWLSYEIWAYSCFHYWEERSVIYAQLLAEYSARTHSNSMWRNMKTFKFESECIPFLNHNSPINHSTRIIKPLNLDNVCFDVQFKCTILFLMSYEIVTIVKMSLNFYQVHLLECDVSNHVLSEHIYMASDRNNLK
jgi:hypothetical protein